MLHFNFSQQLSLAAVFGLVLTLPSIAQQQQPPPPKIIQIDPTKPDPNALQPDASKLPGRALVPVPSRGGSVSDMLRRSSGAASAPPSTRAERMLPLNERQARRVREGDALLNDFFSAGFDSRQYPRNSWAGWWEVNKEQYLLEARNKRETPIQRLTVPKSVAEVMLRAIRSRHVAVRAEAILAVGMMKLETALPSLKLLTQDPEPLCAFRAWTAIALLDSNEASSFLNNLPPQREPDRIGWAMAVGLLSKPTDSMWTGIRTIITDEKSSFEARRMAIWAIRNHKTQDRSALLKDVIWHSTEPILVAEAIQGLPEDPSAEDIRFLVDLTYCTGDTMALPALGQYGVNPRGMADNIRAFPDLIDIKTGRINQRIDEQQQRIGAARKTFQVLREAAIRALGAYPAAGDSARAAIAGPLTMWVRLEGSFPSGRTPRTSVGDSSDILPLGQIGNFDDYTILLDRLEVDTPRQGGLTPGRGSMLEYAQMMARTEHDLSQVRAWEDLVGGASRTRGDENFDRRRPSRSYAAIGIGLMRRKNPDYMVASFRPEGDVLTAPHEALMQTYQMPRDPMILRCAAAVAMGLGGSKERGRDIVRTMTLLQPGEEPVFGYGVLALGMWGDPQTVEVSAQNLGAGRKTIDINTLTNQHGGMRVPIMWLDMVAALRAAAQGMAMLGEPDAIPILIAQWGKDPAVDHELARAILWCRRPAPSASQDDLAANFGESLAQIVPKDNVPNLSASAAACIGILYEREGATQRLDKLIAGGNFRIAGVLPKSNEVRPGYLLEWQSPQSYALSAANRMYYLQYTTMWNQFLPRQAPARGR